MAEYDDLQLNNLPHSLEAEQSILGCILVDPQTLTDVLEIVPSSDMFFRPQHIKMYDVLINMFNESKTIDFVTVLYEVSAQNIFDDDASVKLYLAQLMERVVSVANVMDYCNIVRDAYYRRRLIKTSGEIIDQSQNTGADSNTLLDLAESRIYDIRQGKDTKGLIPIVDVVLDTYDRLMHLTSEDKDLYLGLPSGFHNLDAMITGLNKSDLILLAGRPGMGKTSFALNIATNVAKTSNKDIVVFSLEMSNEQLVSRVLSSEAQISSETLKLGTLSGQQWRQLAVQADVLSKTRLYLDDTPGITVAQMKAKVRRLKDIGLIVIDYLQLMSGGGRNENRVQEISAITRNLKIMAKELNVPIILLSQLNRAAEARQDHTPMLSDLRESGSIEQDADIVMFIYREGYYDPEIENPNIAKCIIAKNRHGSTGEVEISWIGEFTRFGNVEVYREEPPY